MDRKIAIIGGGVCGIYLAFRLETMGYTNWELFESQKFLGGRIHTITFKNKDDLSQSLHCEWGAIRFELGYQKRLERLLKDLDVTLHDFPPFCRDTGWELDFIKQICIRIWSIFFEFRGIRVNDEGIFKLLSDAPEYLSLIHVDKWLPLKESFQYSYSISIIDWLESEDAVSASKLRKLTKSIRAFNVIEVSLMHWLVRWTKVLLSNKSIKTCINGNEDIVKRMLEFLPSEKIHLNSKIRKIELSTNGFSLECKNSKRLFSKVFVSVHPHDISKFEFPFKNNLEGISRSFIKVNLARIFIKVENAWWKSSEFFEMQNDKADALNSREVYYYKIPNCKWGVVMLYFDEYYIQKWRKIFNLKKEKEFLAYAFSISQDEVLEIIPKFWDGSDYKYALSYLGIGYNPIDVMKNLSSLENNTFAIVSDAFSLEPGFIEGGLESCEIALENLGFTNAKVSRN